jgi:arylsulfatase A-like enzyme
MQPIRVSRAVLFGLAALWMALSSGLSQAHPAFLRWPGKIKPGSILNGIVAHEDWLPTFAAMAGAPDVKDELLRGVELNGRSYRNNIDGYNLVDYLTGKSLVSPRNEFIYVTDDRDIVAIRWGDWKVVYKENRGEAFGVWREPFTELRVPLLFNPPCRLPNRPTA